MLVARPWLGLAVQVVLLVALVLVPPADHWPTPGWLLGIASVLTLGGMLIVVLAILRLGRAMRTGPTLVTDGPFRWVRHPTYAGLLALVVGVIVRSGNLVAAAVGAAAIGVVVARARAEERSLANLPGYAAYAAATPRFVPRFRPARR